MGRQDDLPAIGLYQLFVFGQCVERTLIHAVAQQAAVVEVKRDFVAGGQECGAESGGDHTPVAHAIAQQRDIAAIGGGERALVDHAAIAARDLAEYVVARHEISVAQVKRGGHQAADTDLRALTEQHAVRVEDEHLAVGTEVAQYLAGAAVQDAVQGNRRCVGLVEAHRFIGGDIERVPVDGEVLAVLRDGGGVAGLGNRA